VENVEEEEIKEGIKKTNKKANVSTKLPH